MLNKYWRICGTGLSFAIFGIGGLLLHVCVFPLLNQFIRDPKQRIDCFRRVIQLSFRGFVELMRLLGVLRYDISGTERLDRNGLLILANHPTLIDTVFLMAFVRQADCIVKEALLHNPFMRGPIRAAGYVSNHGGPALIDACINSLDNGGNLIIFPEGTRSTPGMPLSFQRGAANIAVRGRNNITPVIIHCRPPTLGKNEKWWQVPPEIAHFRIRIQPDIAVDDIVRQAGSTTLAARRLTTYLQDYFTKAYQDHATA